MNLRAHLGQFFIGRIYENEHKKKSKGINSGAFSYIKPQGLHLGKKKKKVWYVGIGIKHDKVCEFFFYNILLYVIE